MDGRDATPQDAPPPSAVQQAVQQSAALEDRRPGAADTNQVTVWLYPICGRLRALRAAVGTGLVVAGWLPIVAYLVWGGQAAVGWLTVTAAAVVVFYLTFRSGWVEISSARLGVQDTMLGSQRNYRRGEVSSVILRDGRLSISGDDGIPHTRRLRAREERKLRKQLERFHWIAQEQPGGTDLAIRDAAVRDAQG